MFKEIFTREIRYTLGFPISYISLLIFIVFFTFIYSRGEVIVNTLAGEEWVNSPHAITAYLIFFTLIGMLVALPIFNNAAHREEQNHFSEILFTTPISKFHFFFGRFAGAFCLLLIPAFSIVFINILGVKVGVWRGAILAEEFGDFRMITFIKAYAYLVLPNIFIAGSFIFGLVLTFKKTAYAILGAIFLLLCYLFASFGLQSDFETFGLAALLDPFGEVAFNLDTRYQTALERNTLDVSLSGHLFNNRILWLSIATVLLVFTYRQFSFQVAHQKGKKSLAPKKHSTLFTMYPSFPKINTQNLSKASWLHFTSFFKIHFKQSTSNLVFRLLLLFLCFTVVFDFISRQPDYGVSNLPLTYIFIEHTHDYDLLLIVLLIYLCGEMVWTNRQVRIDEVIDVSPFQSVVAIFAKAVAVWVAILSAYCILFMIGISIQLFNGYLRIDLLHYATELLIHVAPLMLFLTAFSVFVHNLVNHKFLAYAIIVLTFISQAVLFSYMDWESNLLKLGRNGSYIFSDFNRYGPFLKANLWFDIYWVLLGILLLLTSSLIWVRGKEIRLFQRVRFAPLAWTPSFSKLVLSLLLIWVSTGSFIFYNTKILNSYSTSLQTQDLREQYERRYKKYEHKALPQITNTNFFIDFFPEERQFKSKALLRLKNSSHSPIDSLFFSIRNANNSNGWETAIQVPDAVLALDDPALGFQIFKLKQSLLPGDSLEIESQANYTPQGFENEVSNTAVLSNGSFLQHARILPHIGYRKTFEIRDQKARQKIGLPPYLGTPDLAIKGCNHHCTHNYLTNQHSWIKSEIQLSTSIDQIALSSGELIREWSEDGRNYFHYRLDQASLLFIPFISARYVVSKRQWRGISLEVYHDPKHDYNIEVMLDEMENAMEYYTTHFGPYFHKHVRIVEFPQYGDYAQAFPGIMPYSESRGFILDFDPKRDNNPIASTVGHEIGHQWWGHQIVGADMQGGQMLTESFAEYSSLMIMKKNVGVEKMIDFLKYDYDRYLWRRTWEQKQELPLYKVADQAYVYYRKGSVVLYTLSELIGEDAVNRSLRNFLNEYRYQPPPYPRSIDYLKHLEKEIPDSLQYLMSDLFYDITFFDHAITNAKYHKLPDGKYQLDIHLQIAKIKVDEEGKEQPVEMNDWFEFGIYSSASDRLARQIEKIKLATGEHQLSFVIDFLPSKVAIDPRLLFFDRQREDNEYEFPIRFTGD